MTEANVRGAPDLVVPPHVSPTMPQFELLLKPSVEKDLRKIPVDQAMKLLAAIDQLANAPALPPDRKLSGTERTWRKRVGDYRIIYEFDLATMPSSSIMCDTAERHTGIIFAPSLQHASKGSREPGESGQMFKCQS